MSFKLRSYGISRVTRRRSAVLPVALSLAWLAHGITLAQSGRTTPLFYPDDPVVVDDDAALDAGGAKEIELSETFDFLTHTFAPPVRPSAQRAVNINTVGEVPDSSWFTNRIGVRLPTVAEAARGPNKFDMREAREWQDWTVTRGKGPGGFHPGFRAVHASDPKQTYQLEVDPPKHPQLASGAELIGTLIYHALGYNVEDVYTLRIDPARVKISDEATVRDASGPRQFTQGDLDSIWRQSARDANGHVYVSATRFVEGENLGQWQYHGTRGDDPNDIHPHEHRRELRANRVFAAWLAHDDSRSLNTLNLRVGEKGRAFIRHYMYDFGAILGSATRFSDPVTNNREYFVDREASLRALRSFGLAVPDYLRPGDAPAGPPSAGRYESEKFDPLRWKANYPNPAFENMQSDDAFWGARLVARFSNDLIRAIVDSVGYDDPHATEHLTRVLGERRDAIARVWLTGVNPIVDVQLAANGALTFSNAAEAAGAARPGATYSVSWFRFDNVSGVLTPVGDKGSATAASSSAPETLRTGQEYVMAEISSVHPDFPQWQKPVQVYFRRTTDGWKTVGLYR